MYVLVVECIDRFLCRPPSPRRIPSVFCIAFLATWCRKKVSRRVGKVKELTGVATLPNGIFIAHQGIVVALSRLSIGAAWAAAGASDFTTIGNGNTQGGLGAYCLQASRHVIIVQQQEACIQNNKERIVFLSRCSFKLQASPVMSIRTNIIQISHFRGHW